MGAIRIRGVYAGVSNVHSDNALMTILSHILVEEHDIRARRTMRLMKLANVQANYRL